MCARKSTPPFRCVYAVCVRCGAICVDFRMEFHPFVWRVEHGVLAAPTSARESRNTITSREKRRGRRRKIPWKRARKEGWRQREVEQTQ